MAQPKLTRIVRQLRVTCGQRADATDRELLERFTTARDEEAFTALVRRHGRFVRAACQQVLTDPADIDDAFQATFLVLLQKAQTVSWKESLGSWLYAVAHRVAVHARANARRRKDREGRASRRRNAATQTDDLSWREACAVLHEELDRLSDRYRLPLLLCYLQGQSRDEAAANLGWTTGAVKGCLERGRLLLANRLSRRGITLSAGLLAAVVGGSATAGGLPSNLAELTLRAVTGHASPAVAALVRGASPMVHAGKKLIVSVLAVIALATAGVGFRQALGQGLETPPQRAEEKSATAPKQQPAATQSAADLKPGERSVAGRVLDPDGKPVAGAVVALAGWQSDDTKPVTDLAKTDGDGRFQCVVPPLTAVWNENRMLVARAAGLGADWVHLADLKKPGEEAVFRLAKATVPVHGRIVTLEGKPVAGAVVALTSIRAPDGKNTLKQVYEQWPGDPYQAAHLLKKTSGIPTAAGLPDKVTTDADGRFTITGAGDGRLLLLNVTGDSIEHVYVRVAVDPGFDPQVALPDPSKAAPGRPFNRSGLPLHGPTFVHPANPCRPITGTVRDQETGKALANVGVTGRSMDGSWENSAFTRTGPDGAYRLVGLPNSECELSFISDTKEIPYLFLTKTVGPTQGLTASTCNMRLVRGVVVTGRVTDNVTGKPINAGVIYAPLSGNEEVRKLPGKDIHSDGVMTYDPDTEGRFRLVAPAGPGIVAVQVRSYHGEEKPYPRAHLKPSESGLPYFRTNRDGFGESFLTASGVIRSLHDFNAFQVIAPTPGTESVTVDLQLDPGRSVGGRIVGPDGKPLRGATIVGLTDTFEEPSRLNADTFTVVALASGSAAGEDRQVVAVHADKKLAGMCEIGNQVHEPPVIRLAPWGSVTGRLVDPDGKPIAGAQVRISYRRPAAGVMYRHLTGEKPATTDADGRFQLDAPFADSQFSMIFSRKGKYLNRKSDDFLKLTIVVGQEKNLGEITAKEDD